MDTQSNVWLLDRHLARLTLPRLSLSFDADRLADGVSELVVDGHRCGERFLGLTGSFQAAGPKLVEWHPRGTCLIVSYETGLPDAARLDLHWHVAPSNGSEAWIARIDLLVSVRTDRLDWRHDVRLESAVSAADCGRAIGDGARVFAAGDESLVVMVHPADIRHQALESDLKSPALHLLRHQLFPTESLEKGVILRARARLALFPAAAAEAGMAAEYTGFVAADPPLGE